MVHGTGDAERSTDAALVFIIILVAVKWRRLGVERNEEVNRAIDGEDIHPRDGVVPQGVVQRYPITKSVEASTGEARAPLAEIVRSPN